MEIWLAKTPDETAACIMCGDAPLLWLIHCGGKIVEWTPTDEPDLLIDRLILTTEFNPYESLF